MLPSCPQLKTLWEWMDESAILTSTKRIFHLDPCHDQCCREHHARSFWENQKVAHSGRSVETHEYIFLRISSDLTFLNTWINSCSPIIISVVEQNELGNWFLLSFYVTSKEANSDRIVLIVRPTNRVRSSRSRQAKSSAALNHAW